MRCYVVKNVIAGEQYLFLFIIETNMSLRVSGRQQALKAVVADMDKIAIVNQVEFGNCFRAILESGMVLQGLLKFFQLETVAYRVIYHWLPANVLVEYPGVNSAEVNGAGLRNQFGNQSCVVGVHMG